MSKRAVLKNISLLVAIIAAVYIVANYTGILKNKTLVMLNLSEEDVKGASTQRAEELSQKFGKDVSSQFAHLKNHFLDVKVSDAIAGVYRLQKIPQDIRAIQEYTKEQVDNVLQSRK